MATALRNIASMHLWDEQKGHTLGIDGLVDDAFMKLVNLNRMEFNDQEHFKALANTFMSRILSNYRRWKERHWGKNVPLDNSVIAAIPYAPELSVLRGGSEAHGERSSQAKKSLGVALF